MTVSIENVGNGTLTNSGGNVGPSSTQYGTITTSGPDRLVCLVLFTGRANTALDAVHVSAVSASGLTFTRSFSGVYDYTDGSYGSFTHGTIALDVWTAPAPLQLTSLAWTSTTDGDGFTNIGTGFVFAVNGVATGSPFDSSNTFNHNQDITGSSTTPTVTGVNTAGNDDLIMGCFVSHKNPPSTAAAGSGWTSLGALSNSSPCSADHASICQYKTFGSPQSGLSVPAGYSDTDWYGMAMSFVAGTITYKVKMGHPPLVIT